MNKKIKESNNVLPNTIKIGYTDYQFEIWPDSFSSTEKAQGEFFEEDEKIGLKGSAIKSSRGVNTLIHEILHAIVYQYGMAEDLKDVEEKVVNTTANALSATFKDNTWLLDYIKKYLEKK
tara:strand:- start:434 stop:793 length:360 start_codon:yes stop_codon:yes gene_type:complete